MRKYLIPVLLLAAMLYADNLLENADFEQVLSIGWIESSGGANDTINRGTTYDPDPDYEAFVFKGYGSGFAKLEQPVVIPSTDLDFSIRAKIYAYDNNADTLCWAAAGVILYYMNDLDMILGDTRICMRTTPCDWQNSPTCHLITVPDSFWHDYSFNIDDELANLAGVNPADVKKISIALYDTTAHTC